MPWFVAAAFLALGAVLLVTGLRQASRARRVRSWTRTVGRVLEARLEEQRGPEEQGFPQWRLVIRYAYEAHGEPRVSNQLWIGSRGVGPSRDRDAQQRWADRFPAGAEVTVWFDPADPRQAVLVPEVPRGQVGGLVAVGLVLLAAGGYGLARSLGP